MGDFDGDGLSDVAVQSDADVDHLEQVIVHYGSPLGPGASRAQQLDPTSVLVNVSLWEDLVVGDANRDGYGDLVTTADPEGLVVFYGGPVGSRAPSAVLGPDTFVPSSLADVDGDGLDDLVATERTELASGRYRMDILVASGDPAGLQPLVTVASVQHGSLFAPSAALPGDWNGDGFDDVLVAGGLDNDQASVLFGSPSGLDPASLTALVDAVGDTPESTRRADVTGDGIEDLLLADPDGIRLYEGRAVGFGTVAPTRLESPCGGDIEVVDLHGDGVLELATTCEGPLYNGLLELHPL